MINMLHVILTLCIGYMCGCVSTGYLIGKYKDIDIRKYGSGNIGTTNALRTMGWKVGLLTLLGDAFKAIIPMTCVRFFYPDITGPAFLTRQMLILLTGFGVVLGHNFPFWLKFKGGKGIAATAGVMLAFSWKITLIALVLFVVSVALTRYVSLGSLLISTFFPIGIALFYPGNLHMLVLGCFFTILAFVKHRSNIGRLIHGTENKLGEKVKINKEEEISK